MMTLPEPRGLRRASSARRTVVCLLISGLALAIFSRAGSNEFLLYDDAQYITLNPQVVRGLSLDGLRWAFTSFYAYNWHPLTWLSHMLDSSLFGVSPRGTHLMNALLHAANAALLFLVLAEMTGVLWRAALVAAGFALHPLHVQSVAWAAERKDLLSAFFWIAAMGGWLRYARRPRTGRYLAAAALFALGLLSKPMVVTLPLVLLLLDLWPLGRAGGAAGLPWRRIVLEKAPLLALSAISAALTVRAQAAGGALHGEVALLLRAENALFSLVAYLGKTLWPVKLSVFYPYPADGFPWWRNAVAALLVATVTFAAARGFRRAPWAAVGWGWYLVSLLPVLGIVQVGSQGMADRYTYLPLVGIFLLAAWGLGSLAHPATGSRKAAAVAACSLLAAWAAGTWVQIGYWRDGVTLFTRSQAVTPDNATVRYNLGRSLLQEGRLAEALVHLERAVALDLLDEHAPNDLGITLSRLGRRPEAIAMFRRAILLNPSYTDPYLNLGIAYLSQNDRRAALGVYRELLGVNREAAAALAAFLGPAAAE